MSTLQADALDLEANVQETLERSAGTDVLLSDIKALLGRMLFTGKSVHKKVNVHAPPLSLPHKIVSLSMVPSNCLRAILSHS